MSWVDSGITNVFGKVSTLNEVASGINHALQSKFKSLEFSITSKSIILLFVLCFRENTLLGQTANCQEKLYSQPIAVINDSIAFDSLGECSIINQNVICDGRKMLNLTAKTGSHDLLFTQSFQPNWCSNSCCSVTSLFCNLHLWQVSVSPNTRYESIFYCESNLLNLSVNIYIVPFYFRHLSASGKWSICYNDKYKHLDSSFCANAYNSLLIHSFEIFSSPHDPGLCRNARSNPHWRATMVIRSDGVWKLLGLAGHRY